MTDESLDSLAVLAQAATREHDPADEDGFPWRELIDGLRDGDVIGLCECDEEYLYAVSPSVILSLVGRVKDAEAERDQHRQKVVTFHMQRTQAEARAVAAESRCHELEAALQNAGICPTCQLPRRRETVGLVCQTCGWDYAQGEKP